MSIARKLIGTTDATASGPAVYVEDVFSTYLYTGTGAAQKIINGIALGNSSALGTIIQINGDAITDISLSPSTFTNVGPVTVNTSIKKYGTGSLFFNGSSKLITSSNSNIPIAAGEDFTIEAWIYPTQVDAGNLHCITTARAGSNDWFFGIYLGKLFYYDQGGVGTFYGNATITANTWQHVAFSRSGTTFRLFLNGVLTDTITGTARNHPSTQIAIGSDDSGANTIGSPYYGYIDDFRVCRGVALYTSNFTPPSAALPVDTVVAGKGGMVWIKCRQADSHKLFDTVRGAQNRISSSLTAAQASDTALTSFTSTGYVDQANWFTSNTVASWTFAKQPKFFDVVTYTGTGSAGLTISHALGVKPGMVIVKRTDAGGTGWLVWHKYNQNKGLALNSTNAEIDYTASGGWMTANSSSFTMTFANDDWTNLSGATYVAYLFADSNSGGFGPAGTDSVVACGSFSNNSPVTLGWEPQFILVKRSDGVEGWHIHDTMRGWPVSGDARRLYANLSNAEDGTAQLFPNATGFTCAIGSGTYIYLAIRRGPMKTPTDATKVFLPSTTAVNTLFSTGITSLDGAFIVNRTTAGGSRSLFSRLTSSLGLDPTSTSAQVNYGTAISWDLNNAFSQSAIGSSVQWLFRRAPGFFDVVCYTGSSSSLTVNHNLGVVPEIILVKRRDSATIGGWYFNCQFGATTHNYLTMNSTSAGSVDTYFNNNTIASQPTSTSFSVQAAGGANYTSTATYVAYLFASCPGVSKVGSYTGSGTTKQIDCGFTSGARFVLIKRTDSTGNWTVWDTARGIVSGNDPYLLLNSTAAEVTNTDYIDPYSAGFEISSTAPAEINANGGSFVFLAVA